MIALQTFSHWYLELSTQFTILRRVYPVRPDLDPNAGTPDQLPKSILLRVEWAGVLGMY